MEGRQMTMILNPIEEKGAAVKASS
jgi:hypothetical protein